ncbi:hypothetical protein NDU88_009753 [Pleurodeles waltl]|uniref:Uncharacterized protein n=1 Tax=Pleurodeles waltl TaxID=8319 RepID=A0AAV7PTC0_PLEWA|nr:hypothetical protein NDU88_009753 [Pleurodeles waltl]
MGAPLPPKKYARRPSGLAPPSVRVSRRRGFKSLCAPAGFSPQRPEAPEAEKASASLLYAAGAAPEGHGDTCRRAPGRCPPALLIAATLALPVLALTQRAHSPPLALTEKPTNNPTLASKPGTLQKTPLLI